MGNVRGKDGAHNERENDVIKRTKEKVKETPVFMRGLFFTARDLVFVSGDFETAVSKEIYTSLEESGIFE